LEEEVDAVFVPRERLVEREDKIVVVLGPPF